jgi:hypothetical protein
MHQETHYPGRVVFTDIENPDFPALARAYGLHGERVERAEAFEAAFIRAREAGGGIVELILPVEAITPRTTITALREGKGLRPWPITRSILITGAAGSLGGHLRTGLRHLAPRLRLVDLRGWARRRSTRRSSLRPRRPRGGLRLHARLRRHRPLRRPSARAELRGDPPDTLPAAYNVYEAARRFGVKRVVYASSIHAVGFCNVEEVPDTRVPTGPTPSTG